MERSVGKAKRGTLPQNAAALAALSSSGQFNLVQRAVNVPRLIRATLRGEDTGLSRGRLVVMSLAALYVLSPLDFIPEAILGPLGLGDDGLVGVALATFLLAASDSHLRRRPPAPPTRSWS